MRYLLTSLLLLLICRQTFGSAINGVITDENKNPVEFTNILLHKYADPSYLNGTTTDSLGKFEINQLPEGEYYVEAVYMGYKTDTIHHISLTSDEIKNIGLVQLSLNENSLADVEVSALRPVIIRKADRVIYDVENSAKSGGDNVLDLLRSVPGVTVSGTDEIRINGKNQIQVMINGKVEQLNGDQLANLLKSIQSSNVKKIEVVSNPSAKYDASAKGGILEIQLKENLKTGVNGSVYLNYRQNKYGSTETGFNLNMNHKKLTLGTVYNFSYGNNFQKVSYIRNFTDNGVTQQYDQYTYDRNKFIGHYANVNMKYAINEKNTIGIGGELFNFYNPHHADATLKILNDVNTGIINSYQNTLNLSHVKSINPSANLNFRSILDSSGSKIDFSYDYTFFHFYSFSHLNTAFLDSLQSEYGERQDFQQDNPFDVNLHTAKIDYEKPLKNKHLLQFGAKFTWTKTHNDVKFDNLSDQGYVNDPSKSNEFQYIENINAAYGIWSKDWGKGWNTNLGLRMEQTNTNQYSITLDSRTKKHYVDFFPSAFIQKTFGQKHNLSVNYSRKIHRPDFKDLNPFQFYNSQNSIWTGNANLKSEYMNITELSYTFDNSYTFMIGFENIMNNYTYLAYQNDSSHITTYQATNFKVRNNLNIGININKDLFTWWSISVNAQYTFFKYNSQVNDLPFNPSSNKFHISADNTFNLPKNFKINLFAFYNTPFLDATDKMKSNGMVNLSVSKSFFDKKLKIRLFANDIFGTLNNSYITQFANVDSRQHMTFGSRWGGISVSYNFQKGKKFQNSRINKSNEEEKSRVGGH